MDISESIERAISGYFTQWLGQHPYLAWSIAHPIPSLGLSLLAILFLWGLIKAIGRGIEQIWLFLLKTPFKLLQPIFRLIWGLIRRILGHNNLSSSQLTEKSAHSITADPFDSLTQTKCERIIERLDLLSQEQDRLLQELATLVKPASRKSPAITSDTQYKDL